MSSADFCPSGQRTAPSEYFQPVRLELSSFSCPVSGPFCLVTACVFATLSPETPADKCKSTQPTQDRSVRIFSKTCSLPARLCSSSSCSSSLSLATASSSSARLAPPSASDTRFRSSSSSSSRSCGRKATALTAYLTQIRMRGRQRSAGWRGKCVEQLSCERLTVPGEGLRQLSCGFLNADWRGGNDAAAPSNSLAESWQREEHSGRAACG